jgi:translation initiation factor IF-3
MNDQIRISPVRLIDEDNNQVGIVSTRDAMDRARGLGLDLVEVSPMEKPPVCRIMDYGKHMYDKKKKLKSTHQHNLQLKEIRIRPKTDVHDMEMKINRSIKFLAAGHKVQFTMLFKGRERFHQELARGIFDNIVKTLGDRVKVIGHPVMAGRRMTLVVQPATVTPKPQAKTESKKESRQKTEAHPGTEPQAKAEQPPRAEEPPRAEPQPNQAPRDKAEAKA